MRLLPLSLLACALASCATVPPAPTVQQRADAWWADVSALSSDAMEGREAGTAGYDRAAEWLVGRLQQLGLEPAGTDGFRQPIRFVEQRLDPANARVSLVTGGQAAALAVPNDMIVSARLSLPPQVDAPLVFVGYGLHIPEAGHDDFANVDLRGKIAVFVGGGPASISGALKSHARSERARLLAERGAVGAISLTTAKATEIPWARLAANANSASLYLEDPALRSVATPFFSASVNPEAAERLFAGSGHSFAEIAALSDASGAVPGFALRPTLRAQLAPTTRPLTSANIVARLPGSDRSLAAEHVVLSAHLDGLGVGAAVNGDRINNGTLDNASGVAALLDVAQQLQRGQRPRRSVLFVFVTGEEKGLLGSRYFSRRPTVARESLVANLNYDMALPLYPLRSVTVIGAEESSIGAEAQAVAASMGLPLAPDPFPNRNAFTRSDQYSFIEQGIPAAAFKFGFAPGTPEAATEQAWRSTRYHSVTDDLSQPVFREDEIRLHDFMAALTLRIANAEARPRWNEASFFRRFAR